MPIRRTALAILTAAVLLTTVLAQAQSRYEYQVIDYPGTFNTWLLDVNDHGVAVGYGQDSSTSTSYPFQYDTRKGILTDVANVDGLETAFVGISESGLLAGRVNEAGIYSYSGVIRDRNGVNTILVHPDAVSRTILKGINDKGLVTGSRDSAESPGRVVAGFLYDPVTKTFLDFAPSWQTSAPAMNYRGDFVGTATFIYDDSSENWDPCPGLPGGSASVRQYSYLRTADGSLTYFLVNGKTTQARGINDVGQITGSGAFPLHGTGAFVFEKTELAGAVCVNVTVDYDNAIQVPGSTRTSGYGITNSGTIVGVFRDENTGATRGFVARRR